MRNWLIMAVFAMLTASLVGGCTQLGSQSTRYTMNREDEALADLVLQRLQNDSITRRFRVGVDVNEGAVTLRGNDPGPEAKQRMYSIVRGTAGVHSVEDSFIGF
jgi:osmotically-inducible protein OsmY